MSVCQSLAYGLMGSRLYKPLRFAYQSVFQKDAIKRRKQRHAFYSQFIASGDLVFDVGANLGNYAEAFCALGATVVAVEPDPRNLVTLKQRLASERAFIEPCAMGREEGAAELHMYDRNDVSTLLRPWSENTTAIWKESVSVPVRTLESLALKYGVPKYVKVDAEGFDFEVLSGMKFEPPLVSFEFQPADMAIAKSCVELLRERVFNFVVEEEAKFELNSWVDSNAVLDLLASAPHGARYGDVFARAR